MIDFIFCTGFDYVSQNFSILKFPIYFAGQLVTRLIR